MARPTAEDRRQDYLRIGADIVAEFDPRQAPQLPLDALANVKVADVAVRAGVTKGALYHIWESQEEYRRDLLAHLLELEEQAGIRDTQEVLAQIQPGEPIASIVRRLSQFAFDRLKDDPKMVARFSFYNYADDPEVKRLLSHGAASFVPFYESYLEGAGRRLKAPFTIDHLITVTTSLFYGMILRYRTSPDLVEAEVMRDGEPWGLYPFCLVALMEHFTEPNP